MELKIFLYAVLVGVALGVMFDFFRLPRIVFNDKIFFDFIFWIISAIVSFCFLLVYNNGEIRGMLIFLIFVGYLICIFCLSGITKPIQQKIAKKIKFAFKSFKKVLQKLRIIYYNISDKIILKCKRKFKGDGNDKANEQKE